MLRRRRAGAPGKAAGSLARVVEAVSEQLTLLHASIAAAPAPGWDCAQLTLGLAQAGAELGKLAPSVPQSLLRPVVTVDC